MFISYHNIISMHENKLEFILGITFLGNFAFGGKSLQF